MTPRASLSSLAVALVLSGCTLLGPGPSAPPPDEVRRLLALLTLRRDQIADVRARADLTVRRDDRVQQLAGVVLLRTPDTLRFEALSAFGQPFLLGTVADGTLTIYTVADNRAVTGPATTAAARRWLGVPLEAEDLVGILIGRVAPPRGLRQATLLPDDGEGPSLLLTAGRERRRVWLDVETGQISKLEIGGPTDPLVIAYRWPAEGLLPPEIHLTQPGLDALLHYQEPVVSGGVDPGRFTLSIPETAEIQRFY